MFEARRVEQRLLSEWRKWEAEAGPGERRDLAVRSLKQWLKGDRKGALSLYSMGLTALPQVFPDDVRQLAIEHNRLKALPKLPLRLQILKADHNELESLPVLPPELRELQVTDNRLTFLPDLLPDDMTSLYAARNRIEFLPRVLPSQLVRLDLSGNCLHFLPGTMPPQLRWLDLEGNRLSGLPHLPPTIEHVNLFANRYSHLPPALLALPRGCQVFFGDNPLDRRSLEQLAARQHTPNDAGPNIVVSMTVEQPERPARPLAVAVGEWLAEPSEASPSEWTGFEGEEGARAFSIFLDRLHQTIQMRDPGFLAHVRDWLAELAQRPALRRHSFAIAVGAASSCEDRIALTFNDMKKARLASDVDEGRYDGRITDLIDLGRHMFRLDMLEKIARGKTACLVATHGKDAVDEIEIYLAYQVKLRDELSLPLDVSAMRFFHLTALTDDDLRRAIDEVREAEATQLSTYLALDWSPWQALLRREAAQDLASAGETMSELLDRDFEMRLTNRLAATGLQHDQDARRIEGARLNREIAATIFGGVTRQFLAARGLSGQIPSEPAATPPSGRPDSL